MNMKTSVIALCAFGLALASSGFGADAQKNVKIPDPVKKVASEKKGMAHPYKLTPSEAQLAGLTDFLVFVIIARDLREPMIVDREGRPTALRVKGSDSMKQVKNNKTVQIEKRS